MDKVKILTLIEIDVNKFLEEFPDTKKEETTKEEIRGMFIDDIAFVDLKHHGGIIKESMVVDDNFQLKSENIKSAESTEKEKFLSRFKATLINESGPKIHVKIDDGHISSINSTVHDATLTIEFDDNDYIQTETYTKDAGINILKNEDEFYKLANESYRKEDYFNKDGYGSWLPNFKKEEDGE